VARQGGDTVRLSLGNGNQECGRPVGVLHSDSNADGRAKRYCRFELEAFLERETALGRADLVFPILYIRVPSLEDAVARNSDPALAIIAKRQYLDWRDFRFHDSGSPEVGRTIARFCQNIAEALHRSWVSPEEQSKREELEALRREEEARLRHESEAKRHAEEARRKQAEAEAQRIADERRQREAEARRREQEQKEGLARDKDAKRTAAERQWEGDASKDEYPNELGGLRYRFEKDRSVSAVNDLGQQVHFPSCNKFWTVARGHEDQGAESFRKLISPVIQSISPNRTGLMPSLAIAIVCFVLAIIAVVTAIGLTNAKIGSANPALIIVALIASGLGTIAALLRVGQTRKIGSTRDRGASKEAAGDQRVGPPEN
jgi:hypothetical protein